MRSELSLDLSSPTTIPLESRMAEFKQDPQKMDEVTRFVEEILVRAQDEAEKNLRAKQATESKSTTREDRNLFNGLKRGKMATRARGIVLRLFEAICNCTNTGPIPTPRSQPPSSKY